MIRWIARHPLFATALPLALFLASASMLLALHAHRRSTPLDIPFAEGPDDFGEIGQFAFTERSGHAVTQDTLKGKVWIAACFFTCCTESCPKLSASLSRLQSELAGEPSVRLVSLTVDPTHDTADTLAKYATAYNADGDRWLFLTGSDAEVQRFVRERLKMAAEKNTAADATTGSRMLHDPRLTLINKQGHIVGYFDGTDPAAVGRLKIAAERLARGGAVTQHFPEINASLNGLATVLLLAAYIAIRNRRVQLHQTLMMAAFCTSVLFLASYLYYHIVVRGGEPTYFTTPGWPKALYFAILFSHIGLAVVVAVMAPITLVLGFGAPGNRHKRIARWTFPIWLYVSVTGVVVYVMLYHLYPPATVAGTLSG